MIEQALDVRRVVDYLQERPDVDAQKLAFLGGSYSGERGVVFLGVEDRIALGILIVGGLPPGLKSGYVEIDPIHFAPQIKVPVLMINGADDPIFPLVTSQRPLFQWLGSGEANKRHRVVDGGHYVPPQIRDEETLGWLDKYFGKVKSDEPNKAQR